MEAPEFIAQDRVKLQSADRPDTTHPHWRRFSGTIELQPGTPPQDFSVIADEARHWAIVEFSFAAPGVRRTYKFQYAAGGDDIPKLEKIETYADVEGARSGLAGEHRIKVVKFQAPSDKLFTLAAFDIPDDAESEADKQATADEAAANERKKGE